MQKPETCHSLIQNKLFCQDHPCFFQIIYNIKSQSKQKEQKCRSVINHILS